MNDPSAVAKASRPPDVEPADRDHPGLADPAETSGTRAKPLRAMLLTMLLSAALVWGLVALVRRLF